MPNATSPTRLPAVMRPFALAYGTAELPALILNSRRLHARRAAAHAPGPLLPLARRNHFDILDELRTADGLLTQQLLALCGGRDIERATWPCVGHHDANVAACRLAFRSERPGE